MARKGSDSIGTIAVIALVAFAIGKMSGDDDKPSERDASPQAFVAPVDYQPAATYAEPEPIAQRFVPDAPQSAFGDHPFANCSQARAAGAAPVYAGDPGYGPHLDRDRDGVGCE